MSKIGRRWEEMQTESHSMDLFVQDRDYQGLGHEPMWACVAACGHHSTQKNYELSNDDYPVDDSKEINKH